MTHNDNKTERVLKMLQILKSHPQGLLRSEIARLLEINLSTVCRYIRDLSLNLHVCENDKHRIYLEPDKFKMHMELNIHELIFIHLASRLSFRSLDRPNPHATNCLKRIFPCRRILK
jgi:predicted DNA-binding transcriptional regulator YafY